MTALQCIAPIDIANQRQVFVLDGDVLHLGRSAAAGVRIDDVSVAARHATLVRSGTVVTLAADQFSDQTLVNGVPVTRTLLRDGDRITLGRVTLQFVTAGA